MKCAKCLIATAALFPDAMDRWVCAFCLNKAEQDWEKTFERRGTYDEEEEYRASADGCD